MADWDSGLGCWADELSSATLVDCRKNVAQEKAVDLYCRLSSSVFEIKAGLFSMSLESIMLI